MATVEAGAEVEVVVVVEEVKLALVTGPAQAATPTSSPQNRRASSAVQPTQTALRKVPGAVAAVAEVVVLVAVAEVVVTRAALGIGPALIAKRTASVPNQVATNATPRTQTAGLVVVGPGIATVAATVVVGPGVATVVVGLGVATAVTVAASAPVTTPMFAQETGRVPIAVSTTSPPGTSASSVVYRGLLGMTRMEMVASKNQLVGVSRHLCLSASNTVEDDGLQSVVALHCCLSPICMSVGDEKASTLLILSVSE